MENCLFCKIIKGEIPCSKVYEDEDVIAFRDISPEAPSHILVIPKMHIESVNFITEQNSNIISKIFVAINKIVKEQGIDETGYRVVNNCGEHGGQTVKHLHFHLLGGRNLTWPPG